MRSERILPNRSVMRTLPDCITLTTARRFTATNTATTLPGIGRMPG
ncbi:MAG: hypothetical protein MI923_26740 [Phycisphaerales bacterium]|nr:hypothetical protein [Phycisphaerales bacterium]